VGFSADSSKLFLVTVDGRRESDSGMSLAELARLMLDLGVYEGMNLDGGGSTTMVIDRVLVNKPSDQTGERAVGNALMVVQKR
jgi:exopolysaccharide biosynthesis protein